jgi:two-component system OmpR family response regulator
MDSPLKIIVVEDHDGLREMTVQALNDLNCVAVGVASAEEFDEISSPYFDICLIDLNLPGEDGISLSRRIRSVFPTCGIIIISVRKQIQEKLAGYESGADFYLTKPTSIEELAAVIMAFRRRFKAESEESKELLRLNASSMELCSAQMPGRSVSLSHHELLILAALARAANNRLESWQLIQMSEINGTSVSKSTLEVQILRLRKKLVQVGASDTAIKGIRGFGYQLCVPMIVV